VSEYFPIVVLFGFGLVLGAAFIALSALLGVNQPNRVKLQPYECGLDQPRPPRRRFAIHFFLVALLFLLFDVEVTFLFPWAILVQDFKAAGLGGFIVFEGLIFIGVLALGLAYVWKRGALEWEQ
jgi:NADH-quinone oxidoreductase subunit A